MSRGPIKPPKPGGRQSLPHAGTASAGRPKFVYLPVAGQHVTTGAHRLADPAAISTALGKSAYLRRTRYIGPDHRTLFDFTLRGADLVAVKLITPLGAPGWTASPFLIWSGADAAATKSSEPNAVRAWQIVADLPLGLSPGKWLDGVAKLLATAFKNTDAIVEFALHAPGGRNPHAHVLVTARYLTMEGFGAFDPSREGSVSGSLKKTWLRWLRRYRPNPPARLSY